MAEFDPQEPAENQKNEPAADARSPWAAERQWEVSSCDTGGCGCGDTPRSEYKDYTASTYSGTEYGTPASPEADSAATNEYVVRTQPQSFWVDLVSSQPAPSETAPAASETAREEVGKQSEQFWSALVQSQTAGADANRSDKEYESSDWQPLRNVAEPVSPAAEPVEAEASADRADVAWTLPQTTSEEWASARSEAQDAEAGESKPTLMSAAVEAAQSTAKAKKAPKAKAEKKPAEKKAKSKKTAAAKKPAAKKVAARKPAAAKKAVKKTPAPKIIKAPTRRAA